MGCSEAHVLEFLQYVDQFGKTKVTPPPALSSGTPTRRRPAPALSSKPGAVSTPLSAASEQPLRRMEAARRGARAVRLYLREVRDTRGKARGIACEKKKKKKKKKPQGNMGSNNEGGVMGGQLSFNHGQNGLFGHSFETSGGVAVVGSSEGRSFMIPLSVLN